MAAGIKLELVVEVDAHRANASIKSVNASLSSMEAAALKTARGASSGIDGLTAPVAKGAAAAGVLASAFESVVGWLRTQVEETARLAARNETLAIVNAQLARANGYTGGSIERMRLTNALLTNPEGPAYRRVAAHAAGVSSGIL
jgi:hypothetical protein